MMVVRPWSDISDQPISEQLIRELFPFEAGYRFYPNRYDAGVQFPSSVAQPIRLYVFEGECTYRSNAGTVSLKGSEYVDLPRGEYEFEVPAGAPIRLMKVFKMPGKA